MIILDTNVLSALMVPANNDKVVSWANTLSFDVVWTTAVTIMEARAGILLLPSGRRRQGLEAGLDRLLGDAIRTRILPFDVQAAEIAARIYAKRVRSGISIESRDTQIAAIAVSRAAILATRNTKHFRDLELELVNPWEA